jgi:ADP-ribose pyrophosphatase YjhB (NUDIX family)
MPIDQKIFVTVDDVIFTIINDKLQVLLIKRLLPPFENYRALPG